jgi:hypothetical protein
MLLQLKNHPKYHMKAEPKLMGRNLRNWITAYAEYTDATESPLQYHYFVGLSLIAAASKRQVWLDMSYFQIYPNLYVILVGPSGARKSIATGIGMQIADKVGLRKFSDKITGAALIRDLANAQEKRVEEGNSEIQFCSPVLIYASELGVFMGADAYGSGVIADLTDLYDCPGKWEKKTIARDSELVLAPYVSMLAASTPQTLKDVIPQGAVGQGFTSRILFVWGGGRRKRIPVPAFSVGDKMLKENLIHDLKHISTLRGSFKFSVDGLDAYNRLYYDRPEPEDEFEDERLRGYSSRKDIHALKLAMCFSLAERDDLVITAGDIACAREAIEKSIDPGLANVFAGHGNETKSEDVVRVFKQIELATRKNGFASHAELLKRNYYHLTSQNFAMVIETLAQSNAIEVVITKDPRTERMTKIYKCIDTQFVGETKQWKPKQKKWEREDG